MDPRPNPLTGETKHSQYNGVTFHKHRKLWIAYTGGPASRVYHGEWLSEHDAARARNEGYARIYGFDPNPNVIKEPAPDSIRYTFVGTRCELILTLAQMKAAGKPIVIRVLDPSRSSASRTYFKTVLPLVMVQPFIIGIHESSRDPTQVEITWNKQMPTEPWLAVPSPNRQAAAVIDRKPSKTNPNFQWSKAIGETGGDCIFAGMRADYQIFRAQTGINSVKFVAVRNLLEMAQLIAGADLFIGNRSAGWAIARGIGKPCVVEP